jgi:hypothetical protein
MDNVVYSEEESKSQQFMKVFSRDIAVLNDVSSGAYKLLFGLFRYVDRDNSIIVNIDRKEKLHDLIGIKPTSQAMYLTELVKKKILNRKRAGVYVLNPHIFGRLDWNNIKQLRIEIVYDFDKVTKKVSHSQVYYLE